MNDKMQVLFIEHTGHVMAAFTRTADPEGKPTIESLVGDGLIVRNKKKVFPLPVAGDPVGETFIIPPDSLEIAVVDFKPDVPKSPFGFTAGGGVATQLAVPPPAPELKTTSIKVKKTGVSTTEATKFWVQLEEVPPLIGNAPIRLVMQEAIDAGQTEKTIALKVTPAGPVVTIPVKDFYLLVLVAGYEPRFSKEPPV